MAGCAVLCCSCYHPQPSKWAIEIQSGLDSVQSVFFGCLFISYQISSSGGATSRQVGGEGRIEVEHKIVHGQMT